MAEIRRLFTTFGFLVATQVATAVIGLAYWAVATHLFSPRDVGLAAASASTGLLLAAVGAVGIPLLLLAEIETIDLWERRVMFTTGMAITGAIVLVLAIGTMALSPYLGKSLGVIGANPITALLFVVGSVATMSGQTVDSTAIGLHRGAAQLWRGSLSSLLKLAIVGLLVLAVDRTSTGLIFAWAVAMVLSAFVCIPMLALGPAGPGVGTIRNRVGLVRRFGKLSLQHHVLNLSISSVSYIVPLMATLLVSPQQVAYFSAAFLLSATLLILPYLLALSLFAERSGDPGLLHRHVRRTFPLGLVLAGAIVLVVEIAAPYALRLFGPEYPVNGTTALRLMILVGPAYVVKDHYVSIYRAQHRMSHASRVMAIGTMAEVAGSAIGGALWGLNGICAGWAISASAEALVLLPAVLRVYRSVPAPALPGPHGAIDTITPIPVTVLPTALRSDDTGQPRDLVSETGPPDPLTHPTNRSRLGAVMALVGVGLLLQGVADAVARNGHGSPALALFIIGMALIFGACAWRLTGVAAGRNERLLVSLVLGLGLLASYIMRYPLLTTGFDELQHVATLSHLSSSHAVFPVNTELTVSPYYPGLELVTTATRWLTGLPLRVDEVIVLAAVRILLVLAIFLVVERACKSSRAGGVGALVYMANSEFYGFDSQYAYETIALALGVAAVYLLFVSVDRERPAMGRLYALALCSLAAVVVTHHLTGWLTVAFVVVWAIGLALSARFRKDGAPATKGLLPREDPAGPLLNGPATRAQALHDRWRAQARIMGIAAVAGVVVGVTWTLFVGSRLTQYVGPIFSAAYSDLSSTLTNLHGNRQLFTTSAGAKTPTWDMLFILGSSAALCLILVPSLYSVVFRRSVRGGPLRYLPALIAATYPFLILANVSTSSKAVAGRATAFVFFGVAMVVGAWLAGRIARGPRLAERIATIGVAILCAVGSILFGVGPVVSILPGTYQVGGDELSLGSPSLAVAHWADMNIPAGTHVAADRDNGDLLNAIGGVDLVTAPNLESIYFDRQLTPYDISLIREAGVRYVFVDDRLAQGLPLYGVYVASGEPQTRLTLSQLNKFDSYPGIRRVYDNGPINVYDVSALLPASERAAPTTPPDGGVGTGTHVGVLVLAVLVVGLWVLRLRRRRQAFGDPAHLVVCGLTIAMVLGIFATFVIRLTSVPPDAVAVVVLLALAALSFMPQRRPVPPTDAPESRRSRPQLLLALLGVALLGVGATVATVAALKEWTPPPELAVGVGRDAQAVAEVQLGSAGPIPSLLEVTRGGRVIWKSDLTQTTEAQKVDLPDVALADGSRVALVTNGKALRLVGN